MNEKRQMEGLLSLVCDDVATDDTYARIRELLKQSKDARRIYLQYVDLDAQLPVAAIGLRESLGTARPNPLKRTLRLVIATIAVAAALVVAFLQFADKAPPQTESVQAMLVAEHAAIWGSGRLPSRSDPIVSELRLLSGLAKLSLSNGVQVLVQGPAVLTPTNQNLLLLKTGRITCTVPQAGHGFTVRTPSAEVLDLGTVFGIRVRADGAEEVHAFRGRIQVQSNLAPKPALLVANEAVRLDADGMTSIPVRSEAFPRNVKPILEYERILRNAYDLSRKDQVRVCYTFDNLGTMESRAISQVTNLATRSSEYDGRVIGARSAEGRFPGSRALRFSSKSDAVRFRFDAELKQATLAAWIRLDDLPHNGFTSLLMTDRWREIGQVHWQIAIRRSGNPEIEFSVLRGENMSPDWYSDEISREMLIGEWAHVVTTYDGETGAIDFYLNGKPVGSRTGAPPVARIGEGYLGAWAPTPDAFSRPLAGTMDEFLLIARPLSAAEVAALYEVGQPVP